MKRYKVNYKKGNKMFRRTADRISSINNMKSTARGGIRL